jgi:hypothetical protein
MASREIKEYG